MSTGLVQVIPENGRLMIIIEGKSSSFRVPGADSLAAVVIEAMKTVAHNAIEHCARVAEANTTDKIVGKEIADEIRGGEKLDPAIPS